MKHNFFQCSSGFQQKNNLLPALDVAEEDQARFYFVLLSVSTLAVAIVITLSVGTCESHFAPLQWICCHIGTLHKI